MRIARASGLTVALLAGGVGLVGCNRDDAVNDTIRSATMDLDVMSPGSAASVVPALDAQGYTKLITKLKSVAGKGGAGQQAAVSLLTARAQVGLANQAAAEAAALERSALNAAGGVRGALQEYLTFSAQASALSQYDPAPLLADLDKQITAREADLTKARKQKQDIDARVAALRSQSQAKMDQAATEHNAEAELRGQAIRVSDTKGAELIVDANKHRRIADAFDVEASTLDAQAAQIAPESPESQLRIDQLTNQRDQFGKSRTEVLAHAEGNRALAASAKGEQETAAAAVDAAVKALTSAREGALPEKYDNAAKLFGDAIASANKAAGANKPQAKLAAAEAAQAMGGLFWAKAQGIASAEATIRAVAEANPPLPNQADYAKQTSDADAAQKQALDSATQAYQDAKTSYEASGVKGDAAARVEEISKGLEGIVLKTSGGSVDLRSSHGGENPAPEAPAAAAPEASTDGPRATVDGLVAAIKAERFDQIGAFMYLPDPAMRRMTDSGLAMLAKSKQLDEACRSKLGKALSDDPNSFLGQIRAGFVQGLKFAGGADISGADLSYTVTGDTATATGPNLPEPLKFRKVGGAWMIDGSDAKGVDDQQKQMAIAMVPVMSKAIDDTIAEVQAGKYKTVDEVNAALTARVMRGQGGGGG